MEAKKLHPDAQKLMEYLGYDKAPSTAYNYSRDVSKFLRWVDKPTDELTSTDVTDWYKQLEEEGYSQRSIWRYGWALRSFFDVMGMPELKRRTPIVSYEVPEPTWLTKSQAMGVIAGIPVLCVSYDLALRVGEVGFLVRSAFNIETGRIEVKRLKHKGQRDTYILELSDWCLDILNEYLGVGDQGDEDGGEAFPRVHGDIMFPMSVSTIQRIFRKRANAVGLSEDYTFHSLRHSRVTHIAIKQLEEKGVVDELSLSKFAGHLRVETTRTYVHLATKYLAFGRKPRDI